jgi:hypothetical protein
LLILVTLGIAPLPPYLGKACWGRGLQKVSAKS